LHYIEIFCLLDVIICSLLPATCVGGTHFEN